MKVDNDFCAYKNNFKIYEHVRSKLIFGDFEYNKEPLISIVIPTYKRPKLLKKAIDSALNQDNFDDYEVIVVDNEPVNDFDKKTKTEKLLSSYNTSKLFYYKNEENLGMTGNWNRCIELARGKWVTMLHDDDFFLSYYLNEIKKYLNYADLIVPNKFICKNQDCSNNENHNYKNLITHKKIKSNFFETSKIREWDFFWNNPVGAPIGTIFKKDKAIEIGGFDDTHYPCADYYFWYKYINEFTGVFLKKKLVAYRILVNESLNKKTLLGFLVKDHFFRKKFLEKKQNYFNYTNFDSFLLNTMISKQTKSYEKLFDYKLIDDIEKKLNIHITKNEKNINIINLIFKVYKMNTKLINFLDYLLLKLKKYC